MQLYQRFKGGAATSAVAAREPRSGQATDLPSHLPVVREGWMYKRGGSHGGRTNWKRRYFLLLGDVLYYMESRSDRFPRGRILLKNCTCRSAEEELRRPHAFGPHCPVCAVLLCTLELPQTLAPAQESSARVAWRERRARLGWQVASSECSR